MHFMNYDIEFKTREADGSWKIRHRDVCASSLDFALKQFEVLEGFKFTEYEFISAHTVTDS